MRRPQNYHSSRGGENVWPRMLMKFRRSQSLLAVSTETVDFIAENDLLNDKSPKAVSDKNDRSAACSSIFVRLTQ